MKVVDTRSREPGKLPPAGMVTDAKAHQHPGRLQRRKLNGAKKMRKMTYKRMLKLRRREERRLRLEAVRGGAEKRRIYWAARGLGVKAREMTPAEREAHEARPVTTLATVRAERLRHEAELEARRATGKVIEAAPKLGKVAMVATDGLVLKIA